MRAAVAPLRPPDGFSYIEVLVVAAVLGTLAAITVPLSTNFIVRARADSSIVAATTILESARTHAISERRNVRLVFELPNRIRLQRVSASGTETTEIANYLLENNQAFTRFTQLPDTPDQFGATTAVNFTGTAPVMFTSEGALVDVNGDIANATIFMGQAPEIATARALTVFGVTGLVRNWKWAGRWVQ